ncbi:MULTISPECIES: chemotaxis response regulator protein-glutamate methylesterase [unclassified Paenibacillus]|uniref:protein-glutamate methylesterase/protein-glutamine glutaminase n=1 Tax=unclassified Paenibacillus TaxID=185978 RepID=UPI001AE29BC8|nr:MULTISPECIES: chemotaxis response regulator protein-glutamate methylesterase [unclassified Paenibacillus]MBP1156452.1 two-component system chemotaxis response regulator CheB [Paenibacillus sp. PvP091]MBP1168162.1 two-component system chemotaxis response regulator CheB [Paenibacillus sp. PvR098]MBP2439190.1 two-component system chemotaxis response regulator CheB [Paenibacillus sp. PvP052]
MKRYGVLIVDDSAFMRRAINLLFDMDSDFFVVGIARNGEEAIEKIRRLKPDVVTMDVEMPEMDGIKALEHIMKSDPVPVVMLSVQTGDETASTLKALELGAVDFFLKSNLIQDVDNQDTIRDFLDRVKVAAGANIARQQAIVDDHHVDQLIQGKRVVSMDLVIIGCSTGGPSALQSILPRFPSDFPAGIVVVQHMPPGFTKPLADRFDHICNLTVKEAEDGDIVGPGTIYIAPAGSHLIFQKTSGMVQLKIQSEVAEKHLYKPSVDVTLGSAAPIYGNRLLSVILTGMGIDGLHGCGEVKARGGRVITESENSCVVYGMPKAVYEAGLADKQVLLNHVYQHIIAEI